MRTHEDNRMHFAYLILVVQVIIIIFYGIFVRPLVHNDQGQNTKYYPMFQDVNVMMLVGFGFLMSFIKKNSWSALSYTFFINAVVLQLYLLWQPFWKRVFQGGWGDSIIIVQKSFTSASYSVCAVLISFGAILGRVGPLELLIMGLVEVFAFSFNQQLIMKVIGTYDFGGSIRIHTFGAFFGLAVSFVLSFKKQFKKKPVASYTSNIFAMIGTLFLWLYWPSFNAGYYPITPYEKSIVIVNTIISLTGSCLGTFIVSSLLRRKLQMKDILNASFTGGVIIGASSGIYINPAAPLVIGIFGGVVSSLGFIYLQQKLQKCGIYDSLGINNIFGMIGVLGGIFSAIGIAVYSTSPIADMNQRSYLTFYNKNSTDLNQFGRSFYEQGGVQFGCTFLSMGLGLISGLLTGLLMKQVYVYQQKQFFEDDINFEAVPQPLKQQKQEIGGSDNALEVIQRRPSSTQLN